MDNRPGGGIGRRKGLGDVSTQVGNAWREWSQIRGTLSALGGGNPELSPVQANLNRESVETLRLLPNPQRVRHGKEKVQTPNVSKWHSGESRGG